MGEVVGFQARKDAPMIADIERRITRNHRVSPEDWLIPLDQLASEWDIPIGMVLWQFETRGIGAVVIEADGYISVDRRRLLPEPYGDGLQLGLCILQSYAWALTCEGKCPVNLAAWLNSHPDYAAVARGDSESRSIKQVAREYLMACGCSTGEVEGRLEPFSDALKDRVADHGFAEYDRRHRSRQRRRHRLRLKGQLHTRRK